MLNAERLVFCVKQARNFTGTSIKDAETYLKETTNFFGLILLFIAKSMNVSYVLRLFPAVKYTKLENGSWPGAVGMMGRSELNVLTEPVSLNEFFFIKLHYAYPFNLYFSTFVTKKPEYIPKIFGIFNAFILFYFGDSYCNYFYGRGKKKKVI